MNLKHTFFTKKRKNSHFIFVNKHKKNTQFYIDEEENINNEVENQHREDYYDTCSDAGDIFYILEYNGIFNNDKAFKDRLVVTEEMIKRLDEKIKEDEIRHQLEELQRKRTYYQMYINDLMAFGDATLYESDDENLIRK